MMIQKDQATRFLSQITEDYCTQLREQGHKQAAELVRANGLACIQSLSSQSAQPVPDNANDPD